MTKAGDVVKQPLNDLNIVKPKIAPVLVARQGSTLWASQWRIAKF
jgi:hypothetical protein